MFAYAFTFLAALAVTFILTPAVKNFAVQIGAVDKPDARKVHHGLVPRLGGLAIYAGFMVSVILTVGFTYEMTGIMIGATCLVFVGIADDIVSLPAKVKLLGQILSAAVLVIFFDVNIDWIDLPYVGIIEFPLFISIPLTIFWIIGFINTVNLIDGLDGLAAGIATIASIAIALLAFQMGQWVSAAAMVAMTGACLGFLQYNFNPAKIFMGDTGSMFLGYVIAAVSVMGSMKTAAAAVLIVPLVALAVPITDTVLAIVRRRQSGGADFFTGQEPSPPPSSGGRPVAETGGAGDVRADRFFLGSGAPCGEAESISRCGGDPFRTRGVYFLGEETRRHERGRSSADGKG